MIFFRLLVFFSRQPNLFIDCFFIMYFSHNPMKWLKRPIIPSKSTKMHTSGSANPWVLILQFPDVVAACLLCGFWELWWPWGCYWGRCLPGSRRMELYISLVPLVFHRWRVGAEGRKKVVSGTSSNSACFFLHNAFLKLQKEETRHVFQKSLSAESHTPLPSSPSSPSLLPSPSFFPFSVPFVAWGHLALKDDAYPLF